MQIRWTRLDPVRGISWHFATKFGVGRKLRDTADPLLTLLGAVPDRVAAKQVPTAAGWGPRPGMWPVTVCSAAMTGLRRPDPRSVVGRADANFMAVPRN